MEQIETLSSQAEPVIERIRSLIGEEKIEQVPVEVRALEKRVPGGSHALARVMPGMLLSNYPPLLA